ncbi:TRAM domain-containing protein [Haloplanus sp. GCM10025708]|uniref:TRAM domain-containing protein n=1 Tax=Haloferacaceae TaxID=1644056 RepID=UPI0036139C6E
MSANDAPVTSGETHVLEIRELGSEGDGVGYVGDFAVLVPNGDLGEIVRVEITDVGPNFARADILEREFGG